MKAKSFIVTLVAVFAAVLVSSVMATSAKAAAADPSLTITAAPNPVVVGGTAEVSGTVYATAPDITSFDSVEYTGADCVAGNETGSVDLVDAINWDDAFVNGTWSYTSDALTKVGTYSFDALYLDSNGSASGCVNVTVVAAPVQTAENETWVCYSHFQDAPVAMTVGRFNFLTKALQPEMGMKPYWSNGFVPFANKTAASGQAIGNGYYLHCNLAGPPVTPNVWVNSDGMPIGGNVYADWVAGFGTGATDPAGKPAAFDFYPVVAN